MACLGVVYHRPAVGVDSDDVRCAADHDTGAGALNTKGVLALDEYLAAALFEFFDKRVHQVGVLHVPLGGVEVAGHLRIALVISLEPRGKETTLVAG